jgi:hypothetical protein
MKTNLPTQKPPCPADPISVRWGQRLCLLALLLTLASTAGYGQWVVTDFYNGVINTVSQIIQSASKIINSEAFKHAVKVAEKLKDVQNGVQEYRRIQEIAVAIQSSAQSYKHSLDIIAHDKHFTRGEIARFYETMQQLVVQDSKLLDDLQKGIQANLLEMNSAERLAFINTIHRDALASEQRLKQFIAGMEMLSLRRAYTTNDKIATLELYASARRGGPPTTYNSIDFGAFTESEIDIESLDERGRANAQDASKTQQDWMNDPNNPVAKEAAIRNILNDPMPQQPQKPGALASDDKWNRYHQLRATYQDRLENWQALHEKDLTLLGRDVSAFVMNKPSELSDKEWMEVLVNKMRKGQL